MSINLDGILGVSATGNITGNYIFGNGSQLTGIVTSNVDLGNISQNVIPSSNVTYSLGNSTNQWKDLWVSNSTIYLNSLPLSTVDANGVATLQFNSQPIVVSSNTAPPQTANIATTANIIAGNVVVSNATVGAGVVFADGTVQYTAAGSSNYGDSNVSAYLSSGVNANGFTTNGSITAYANINAQPGAYFIGDGSQLSGMYGNANVEVYLPSSNTIIAINSNIANTDSNVANLTINLANTDSNVANLVTITTNTNSNVANLNTALSNTNSNVANLSAATANNTANIAELNISVAEGVIEVANTNANVANTNSNVANLTISLANTNSNVANIESNVTTLQGQVYSNINTAAYLANANTTGNIYATNITAGNTVTATTFIGNFQGNITGNLVVPGANTWVIYNNAGNAGSDIGFRYDAATQDVVIGNTITANFFVGDGSQLANITAANLVGAYGNANVESYLPTSNTIIGIDANVTALSNSISNTNSNVSNLTNSLNNTNSNVSNVASNVTTLQGQVYTNSNVSAYLGSNANVNISTLGNITTTANISGAYILGNGSQLTGLPAGYSNADVATYLASNSNVTITTTGNITTTANISGAYILGNGSQLTGLPAGYSNADVATYLASNANVTITTTGAISTAGNVNAGNINSSAINLGTGGLVQDGNTTILRNNNVTSNSSVNLYNDGTMIIDANTFIINISGVDPTLTMNSSGFQLTSSLSATGNITGANIIGTYLYGDGSNITGLPVANSIVNGDTSVSIPTVSGNATITANGFATWTFTDNAETFIPGSIYGNPAGGYNKPTFIQPQGDDPNWAFGITDDGNGQSWIQASYYGSDSATRGFRVYDNNGNTVPFNVDGLGNVNATGNLIAAYLYGDGSNITGLPAGYSNADVSTYLASGNDIAGYTTAGDISANNIVATSGLSSLADGYYGGNVSVVGNVNAAYLYGDGSNITGLPANYSNTSVATYLSSGNVSTNILTTAAVSATGNVTAGNFSTTGQLSATGNVSAGNVRLAGTGSLLWGFGGIPIANITPVNDNSTGGLTTQTDIFAPHIYLNTYDGANLSINSDIGSYPNQIRALGYLTVNQANGQPNTGTISAQGNITAGAGFIGDGSQITGLSSNPTIANIISNVDNNTSNITTLQGQVYNDSNVAAYLPTYTGNLTAGNVIFTGNLVVQGTTTTVDSNNVSINDLVFNVANNANAAIYANGAGLGVGTVASEYATFLWNSTSDTWTASNNLSAIGNISGNYISGNGSQLTGMYGNTNVEALLPTYTGLIGGTLTTNAQPNITSLGTLGSLAVTNNINANGLGITGNATIDNLVVTGTTTITGNIQQVSGNSGSFYGDAFGFGALYTGISTGYANLPATVLQVSANYPDYAQVNFQNINSGSGASADYIITADNGTNTTYYVDLGIASSTFDGLSANALGNVVSANDAYLYTFGNGAGNNGGNLIVGAGTDGKVLKLIAGGGTTDNVIATIANTGVTISGLLSASGNITATNINAGTQISAAGIVYGSNFYTIGQVSAAGNITSANLIATANVIGSNLRTAGLVSATGNVIGGNILTAGNISATGNVTGAYLVGNVVLNTVNIALGSNSGANSQGASGVAVGNTAGAVNQGTNAVAIGTLAAGNVGTTATSSNAFIDGSTLTILGNITGTFASTMLITGSGVSANTNIIGATTSAIANAQITGTELRLYSASTSTFAVGTSITGVGVTANTYISARQVSTMAGVSVSGTTLTVGTVTGDPIQVGMYLVGAGLTPGYYIVSNISGSGAGSTWQLNASATVALSTFTGGIYTVNQSQTVGPVAMTAGFYTVTPSQTVAGPISITGTLGQGANSIAIGTQAGSNTQGTNSVAIGVRAGSLTQGTFAIALGFGTGANTQGSQGIAIGYLAGNNTQGTNSVAIGTNAGATTQAGQAVAIGYNAGQSTQATNGVAIGTNAGQTTQGAQSVAVGVNAALSGQGSSAVAVGYQAGSGAQGSSAVAVGSSAGGTSQGSNSVAVGVSAGATSQGAASTAVGQQAGATTQAANGTAVGAFAGQLTQGGQGVAVGYGAAQTSQGTNGTAIGYRSAQSYQGGSAVAVGVDAGRNNQFNSAVAIGNAAGTNTQRAGAIAIGNAAGSTGLSASASNSTIAGTVFTADGNITGNITVGMALTGTGVSAGTFITALGTGTGANGTYTINQSVTIASNTAITLYTAQGNSAVAIGNSAGQYGQGANAVAIGTFAGNTSQGINAIAIGKLAGNASQAANSIIINASGNVLNGTNAGLYVNPVRNDTSNVSNVVYFNTTTKELTYGPVSAGSIISNGTSNVSIASANGSISFGINGSAAGAITSEFPLKSTVALGVGAGGSYGNSGIAIGYSTASLNQGYNAIALGSEAGRDNQGPWGIALGLQAAYLSQGQQAIAIGVLAGSSSQGNNSIAIGANAGQTSQPANSIIINATGLTLNGSNSGFYVNPVRNDTGNVTNAVYYNSTTKELTYGPGGGGSSNAISNGTSNVSISAASGNITFGVGGTNAATFSSGNTFINNIRSDSGNVVNQMFFNSTTKEITYNPVSNSVITFNSTAITANTSNVTNSYDCTNTQIFYVDISAATGNWGVNLANLTLSNSAVSTVTFLLDPVGASPTYNPYNVFQVNGSNVTPRWVNGVQPPIVAGYINTLTYSLLNNGGNIIVLASSSDYA